jgi:hypothetical protein
VAGAAATVTLVAVGPGDVALGAKAPGGPDGAHGKPSRRSGPGANGDSFIGRGRGGPNGHTGKPGNNGSDGPRLGRRASVDIPRVRGIGREARQRIRLILEARRAAGG